MDSNGLLEMVGEVRFTSDHTFTEREWDATNVISDTGDWRVSGGKLMLNFHGDGRSQSAKQLELPLTIHDPDHFTLRQANGRESTFERLK